jgi:tetratricopeptide (TPR) repeat protein
MQALRPSLLFFLAQTLIFFKQQDRALQALESLLREQPNHQRAWSIAAFLHAEKGRLHQAADAFGHALALDPADAPTLFNAGFVLQRLGRHEEAIERFTRAIEIDPKIDRAWYGLGLSLVQRGRYREAIDRLSEASRLQPFNPFARYQLAAAWFKLGEPDKVQAEYRHVKGFDPTVAEHIRSDFGVPKDPD